jgi:hypothetical protein
MRGVSAEFRSRPDFFDALLVPRLAERNGKTDAGASAVRTSSSEGARRTEPRLSFAEEVADATLHYGSRSPERLVGHRERQ